MLADKRWLVSIKESWLEGGSVYGNHKVSADLRDLHELGEQCGVNRAYHLMRSVGVHWKLATKAHAQTRLRAFTGGVNQLQGQFDAQEPNRVLVTGITDIRTGEGSLYLPVVPDLFSR